MAEAIFYTGGGKEFCACEKGAGAATQCLPAAGGAPRRCSSPYRPCRSSRIVCDAVLNGLPFGFRMPECVSDMRSFLINGIMAFFAVKTEKIFKSLLTIRDSGYIMNSTNEQVII